MTIFGKYDKMVRFKTLENVSDGYGGTKVEWVELLSTFARMVQVGARKDIEQMQIEQPKTYRLGIMKRKSFYPSVKHTVEFLGENYDITGVTENDLRLGQEYVIDIVKKEK